MPFLTGTRPEPLPDTPPVKQARPEAPAAADGSPNDLSAAGATGQGQP
ncbi:hypothetical protein G7085_02970 [Tessaracoccus sp. HDW20]|nr:hypothetical protein [Tessaracoccus coleopterorum]NHB83974.1 hypothetical protein [Tessaracoccus coleopterorum]